MTLEWAIEEYEQVSSTQDIVKQRAHEGADQGFVVHAHSQSKGRGRHGRPWVSQPGNLFFSILLRPDCQVQSLGELSLLVGLSIVQVFDYIPLSLKWPNDVLLRGEKCAGVLLESELNSDSAVKYVALGVGLNIVSAPDEIGVALADYSNEALCCETVRDAFLTRFGSNYELWHQSGFDAFRDSWLSYAHPKGSALTVKVGERLEKGCPSLVRMGSLLFARRMEKSSKGRIILSLILHNL